MSYKDRTRKTITLPSGSAAVIRKFTALDSMNVGDPPLRSRLRRDGKVPVDDPASAEEIAYTLKSNIRLATECCLSYTLDGADLAIVDKPVREIADTGKEISVLEVPPEDFAAIVEAVLEFSGMSGKEAAPVSRIFPQEQTDGSPGS